MAVDKITFADKVSMIESTLPIINRIRDIDVNEIKSVVNNNADELETTNTNVTSLSTITTGTGTANTTYINNVENNHWEKVGHVVSYAFTMRATGTWDSTTEFVTGLPKPKAATRFMGVNSSNNSSPVLKFVITAAGTLKNAYSHTAPTANQIIEGQITYITTE